MISSSGSAHRRNGASTPASRSLRSTPPPATSYTSYSPRSATIRREAGIATGAVGLISDPHHAEEIVAQGKADAVLLARAMLRDPYWPLHAADALNTGIDWPKQYGRAK